LRRDAHQHQRYEALAAAHALGEATEAERAEFASHALSCQACAEDAKAGAALVARLAGARDEERWQPQVDGALEARLAIRRAKRSNQTFTVLGYAVAASLVINIAFVGGFAGRALDALRVTPEPTHYSGTTRIVLERRAPRLASAPATHYPAHGVAVARRAERPAKRAEHLAQLRTPQSLAADQPASERPDVFAGIALDPYSRDESVALEEFCADQADRADHAGRPERERADAGAALPPACAATSEAATPGAPAR
jgi:hypothetical protein